MDIFLSWSGVRSYDVATSLREWLPKVIQNLRPWISASDSDKGSRWLSEISEKLESTNFGLLCLTAENLNEPWILFEAGALSKAIGSSYVCPVLLEFDASSLKGPLSQFQATRLEKDDMLKLIKTTNRALEGNGLPENQVEESFFMWWPKLEEMLKRVPKPSTKQTPERSDRDILEEVLKIARRLDRQSEPPHEELLLSLITRKALATLTPREEKILRMRFGIGEKKEWTEEEIANAFGIDKSTISEITANALRKLRHPSRARILGESLLAELLTATEQT